MPPYKLSGPAFIVIFCNKAIRVQDPQTIATQSGNNAALNLLNKLS